MSDLAPLPPGVPRHLGRYRLLRPLGAGGMGQVFVAAHVEFPDRLSALKILHQGSAAPQDIVERFRQEIRTLARLAHPRLVRADNAGVDQGILYLVMQFLDGVSLHQLLARHGAMSPEVAAELTRQAAEGLAYLKTNGIVHRDIKPGNLQYLRTGDLKILDLGVARLRRDLAAHFEPASERVVLGTPDYMAPEQAAAERDVDSRADVYSLGCTLYRLLTNRLPYPDACGLVQKLVAHQAQPFPEVDRPNVPGSLCALVRRMTAKVVGDRPWPDEVAQELARYRSARPLPILPCDPVRDADTTEALPAVPDAVTPGGAGSTVSGPSPAPFHDATTEPAPASTWSRRGAVALLGGAVLCAGVWSFLPGAPRRPEPRDLDAPGFGVEIDLLAAPPLVVVGTAAGQPLTVTGPALLLFGTTAAREYRLTLLVRPLGPPCGQLVVGYTAAGPFDFAGPDPERGFTVGRRRVAAGQLGEADVWAEAALPPLPGEQPLQLHYRWGRLDNLRYGNPLPHLDARLFERAALPAGGVGLVVATGQVAVTSARFVRLA